MNSLKVSVALVATFFLTTAGVYRHDVSEQKYIELGAQPQFDCVGKIELKKGEGGGSCVLIGEQYVLSAAHVFIESDTREKKMNVNGQEITVFETYNQRIGNIANYRFEFGGKLYDAAQIIIHPEYLNSSRQHCDIALVKLKQKVTNVVPANTNKKLDELHAEVTGIGYGASGIASKPETVDGHNRKIGGENIVDSIGGHEVNGVPIIMYCDFDHAERTDCNRMGSATPRSLEYISAGGDSGGGLFRQSKNGWELIGICTGGGIGIERMMKTGYYGQIMEWTRVSAFKNWVADNMK